MPTVHNVELQICKAQSPNAASLPMGGAFTLCESTYLLQHAPLSSRGAEKWENLAVALSGSRACMQACLRPTCASFLAESPSQSEQYVLTNHLLT